MTPPTAEDGLNARGLLQVRRANRHVYYRIGSKSNAGVMASLHRALHKSLRSDRQPVERIFRLATAFTHPRRIEVFDALRGGVLTVGELATRTGISAKALRRHLDKLEDRGFVESQEKGYRTIHLADDLAKALGLLAHRRG